MQQQTRNHLLQCLAVATMLVGTVFAAPPSIARAQDVQITGPLAGAPAVRLMRVYREGRFQLRPTASFTLQDEYTRTILAGAQAQYHLTDWLGIGAFGSIAAMSLDTGLTNYVKQDGTGGTLSVPDTARFDEQIGRIKLVAGGQVTFIPLRGKLALFQALFVDADFLIFGGAAAVQVEERSNAVCPVSNEGVDLDCARTNQVERSTRLAIAPTFGAGLSLHLNEFLGLTFEWRAMPFAWNTSGTDEAGTNQQRKPADTGEFPNDAIGDEDRIFHFNQMASLGLAIYFPLTQKITE